MEKKKLTRDQHLIQLIREDENKDARIKELESEKKDFEKRLKKLEQNYQRLLSLLKIQDRKAGLLKEKASTMDHQVQQVQQTLGSITKRR